MILHICNSDKKFILPFIDLINANFNQDSHFFLIYGGNKADFPTEKYTNVEYWPFLWSYRRSWARSFQSVMRFLELAGRSEKIILHSLFNQNLVVLLAFFPKLLKKCYWVIWGGDLYFYRLRSKNIRNNIFEFFRRILIKHLRHFVTYIEGDYELVKKVYKAKGKLHRCFMYTSNIFESIDLKKRESSKGKIKILVGNSADPTNNQLEVFEKLKKYSNQNIEIFAPLSYGNKKWAEKVINEGKNIFGENFHPLTEFMPLTEYQKLLASIDIAIFNHKRQQAMGNIINLLGTGKKVYIRDDITTWSTLLNLKLKIYSVNNFENILQFDNEIYFNQNCVKNYFTLAELLKQWGAIFND
jgi:hypothetical protein